MNNRLLPRERFLEQGPESLSDSELLAILLHTGTSGTTVIELAEAIMASRNNCLLDVGSMDVKALSQIRGMGTAKSVTLCAAFALAKRIAQLRLNSKPCLNNPELIAEYLRSSLHSPDQEEFHVFMLDTKMNLIKDQCISIGLVDRSLVHPREVFRAAINASASNIIIAHNHPSGEVTPSKYDIQTTEHLISAGKIIGIDVLDHIITPSILQKGQKEFLSMRRAGILNFNESSAP